MFPSSYTAVPIAPTPFRLPQGTPRIELYAYISAPSLVPHHSPPLRRCRRPAAATACASLSTVTLTLQPEPYLYPYPYPYPYP